MPVGASWKMSVTDRFPKDRKPWNKAKKQSITVIMRGAHDDGSHNPKCLMGLRPGGNAVALAYRAYEPQALCQHLRLTL